jgi:hypothetical protein
MQANIPVHDQRSGQSRDYSAILHLPRSRAQRAALVILVYFILLALSYSASTPIFEAPDEAAHFLYAHNIVQEGALPLMTNRAEVLASLSWQRHQPPLLYLTGALLIAGIDRSDLQDYLRVNPLAVQGNVSLNNLNTQLHSYAPTTGNTLTAVRILRLLGLLLASSTIWFIYKTGYLVSGQPLVGLLAMLLVASMPTFLFIAGSINNDNLVTFLHTVGVYWLLDRWKARRIGWPHAALIGLIAGGLAIAKFQGLPFIGLAGAVLLYGGTLRRWRWRQAALGIGGLTLGVIVLAGWWYLRNHVLYGDPLGAAATRSIWGRGAVTTDLSARLIEMRGVWESMWFMLGYLNIRGPAWFYPYVALLSAAGLLAGFWGVWRHPERRFTGLLLAAIIVMLWVTLYVATGQINTSQGRFLFGSLVAFAPLVTTGLFHLLGRQAVVTLFPLIAVALLTPALWLNGSYRPLEIVTDLPAALTPIDRQSEGLKLVGYRLETPVLPPDGIVRLDVYLQGRHPADPAMIIAALDPLTGEPAGVVDFYPGMAALSTLDSSAIYRLRAVLPLRAEGGPPHQIDLLIRWRLVDPSDPAQGRVFNWDDGKDSLLIAGPLIQAPDYSPPAPQTSTQVRFGDAVELTGYTLPAVEVAPGQTLPVTLFWRALSSQTDDLRLAFGLLSSSDQILVQADGIPPGLPSTVWLPGLSFPDPRPLAIPPDAPPGEYRLYLAWYRSADNARLPLSDSSTLYLGLPTVRVR